MESLLDLHARFDMASCSLWSLFQGGLASNVKALAMDWKVQKDRNLILEKEKKKEIVVNLTLWVVCGNAAKHEAFSVGIVSFTSSGFWRSASLHSVDLPCVFLARWRYHLY